VREKIEIFKCSENGEIKHQREDEPFLAVRVQTIGSDFLRNQEIHAGAADHKRKETPIPPAIKEIAREQQKNVLSAAIQAPIGQHNRDQENKVRRRVKKHSGRS